ncbi:hypothetical protein VHEMI08695 [[Torrubiella] hemipterigena]|uniref:Yippee domain-containing protein n=1 Tax=[Torrubiella] hemipterigena TaxID=1531966 RepID=A0A0A1T7H4_9HYPO|nr:hypothetical protein VHEMI08695 [[Torrubiella] hemipterigena]
MGRDSRISATKPIFATFLLSSLHFPFWKRYSSTSTPLHGPELLTPSSTSTAAPVKGATESSVVRLGPDTLRCTQCSTDLALKSQIVSKGFTGRHGRALLVAPPPDVPDGGLANIRIGRSEDRQLVTGWHVVADISCVICCRKLGWKYVDATEKSQHYKVGKYILETERVTLYRSWGDAPKGCDGALNNFDHALQNETDVSFDSEDEDECDDIFAGVWNADEVAKRRGISSTWRNSAAPTAEE